MPPLRQTQTAGGSASSEKTLFLYQSKRIAVKPRGVQLGRRGLKPLRAAPMTEPRRRRASSVRVPRFPAPGLAPMQTNEPVPVNEIPSPETGILVSQTDLRGG
jgi:hypothetical protein